MFNKTLLAIAVASSLLVSACGGSSSSNNDDAAPTPPPTNSAPTDISVSSASVDENAAGAEIGTLSATDADSDETFTFTTQDGRFVIDGTTLSLADDIALDYETQTAVKVDVTVTDSSDQSFTKTLTIDIADLLDFYDFESAFINGESAVSYSGQIARHLLINDLAILIDSQLGDTTSFDTDGNFTTREEVIAALNSYFDVTDYDALSQRALLTTTAPSAKQQTLADVSSSSKNLVDKIAGNDEQGQHKDWNNGEFVGWGEAGSTTPEGLIRLFFNELADNADAQLNGTLRQDPFGNDITSIYLTEDGRDLKQLIQKFLLMSVAYSQGADDYLDSDTPDKGLRSDHTNSDETFTSLEHQFDEGFGYFGAARDYLEYTDEEIAAKGGRDDWQGYHDTDGDDAIDFNAEYNFGQSANAAKRDLGATTQTDYTAQAMSAFLMGRKLLNDTAGAALTQAEREELEGYRDSALDAWERAIAATVIHYINDTHADLGAIGNDDFNYSDLAKHWSEMKGFALGLQFNRFSPVTDAQFSQLHVYLGDKPELADSDAIAAYQAKLMQARDILEQAYGFDSENVANW